MDKRQSSRPEVAVSWHNVPAIGPDGKMERRKVMQVSWKGEMPGDPLMPKIREHYRKQAKLKAEQEKAAKSTRRRRSA